MTAEERAYELALDIVMTKDVSAEDIQQAILTAIEEERESCAKICDSADKSTHPSDLADAIRARSKNPN